MDHVRNTAVVYQSLLLPVSLSHDSTSLRVSVQVRVHTQLSIDSSISGITVISMTQ